MAAPDAGAQCTDRWLENPVIPGLSSGTINSMVWWDPDGDGPRDRVVVVGGTLSFMGPLGRQRVAAWDPASGEWSAIAPSLDGHVQAIAVTTHGELIIAGRFRHSAGFPIGPIARWRPGGWEPLTTSADADVYALAPTRDGGVIAGGKFLSIDGLDCQRVARWDRHAWRPMGSGMSGSSSYVIVQTLAVLSDETVIAGGIFSHAGGAPAVNIAAWDASAWRALGDGLGSASWFPSQVYAVGESPSGVLTAGGWFFDGNASRYGGLAEWDGTAWHPVEGEFGNALDDHVHSLAWMPGGDLIVGGNFRSVDGVPASNIARWDGSAWHPLAAGFPDSHEVMSLLPLDQSGLFAGTVAGIGRWDGQGWSSTHNTRSAKVENIATLADGDALINPGFSRWNGMDFTPISPAPGGTVEFVQSTPDARYLVGGTFAAAGDLPVNSIAFWDGVNFSPLGAGLTYPNAQATAFAATYTHDAKLFVGGEFYRAGDKVCRNIAVWNGGVWSPVGSGANGAVRAIRTLPDGTIVAGGVFTVMNGKAISGLAHWNGAAWNALGTPLKGWVQALELLPDGSLVAAGELSVTADPPAYRVAIWRDYTWSHVGAPFDSYIEDIRSLPEFGLVAVGYFTKVGDTTVSRVARWDADAWRPFGTGADAAVYTVAPAPGGGLAIGGVFKYAGGQLAPYIARWRCACDADFNQDGVVADDDLAGFLDDYEHRGHRADFNDDGFINADDFDAFAFYFEQGC